MLPKIVVSILIQILLSAAPAETIPSHPFAYAGLSLATEPQSLAARFPRSSHEFLESYSGTTHSLAADGSDKFQQVLRAETGKYRVRLAERESIAAVYLLEFEMAAGKVQGLKLSFEKPEEFFKTPFSNQDERFPACGPILSSLSTQHGKPANLRNWEEEALQHYTRTWRSGSEQFSLECGQYMGRTKVFALEVTVTR